MPVEPETRADVPTDDPVPVPVPVPTLAPVVLAPRVLALPDAEDPPLEAPELGPELVA